MNTPADQIWSQAPENMDTMAPLNANLDDLSNIFNIDDFDLDNLPDMHSNSFGDQIPQSHPGTHPSTPFDENMGQLGVPPGTVGQEFGAHNGFNLPGPLGGQPQFSNEPTLSLPFDVGSMYQPSMPQQYPPQQHQNFNFNPPQQQHHFPPSQQVPPTPNSLELHGEAGRFMQQQMDVQQRAMLQQQYQMRKEQQVQFTPMASPSGTPYHLQSDFTVPGDFFSPLTSPALHAQNASQAHQKFLPQQQGYYTNPSTAASSAAPSPNDPNADVEMGGDAHAPTESQTKKPLRRKPATPRTFAMNKVKQSPIQKPQKRKSIAISSKDADIIVQDAQKSGHVAPKSTGMRVQPPLENSENDSVSPEALNDMPMGPPPRPGSVSQSPAISAQTQQAAGPAATPKSLLSMKSAIDCNGPASSGISGIMGQASLEDLELPEAVENPETHRSNVTLQPSNSQEQTPRLSASRKTPKLGPLSTPASARPLSASGSPAYAISPMTASTPAGLLKEKKDGKSARASSNKRGSVSTNNSAMVSPALRPKVSPSIKPLLPEGTNLHSPTHALLLASKSNYQNLLEGNHLPGISYPDSLSTGLTSKRTSHKVAEQGRRNRINDALKEMQALIPASSGARAEELMTSGGGDDDSQEAKEKDRDAAIKSNSSKAATVESANRYIRVLKETEAAQKAAMAEMKKAMDEMRVRLGETTDTPDGESASSSAGAEKADVAPPQAMDDAEDAVTAAPAAAEAVK